MQRVDDRYRSAAVNKVMTERAITQPFRADPILSHLLPTEII